jgi:DtxR family Mn-dependent transcriptional regulator
MGQTATEQNYLKAICKLSELDVIVSTSDLANELKTTPASVTDMIKKLSEKGWIQHQPYKGVKLSSEGRKIAMGIIRKHRLWEVFLVEKLKFSWDEIHEIAEQLEHIESDELIRKLDVFLDRPKFDPHGDPIPDEKGKILQRPTRLLSSLAALEKGELAGVLNHTPDFLQYLNKQGLTLGSRIQVLEILPFDQSIRLKVDKKQIQVSPAVSHFLLVI